MLEETMTVDYIRYSIIKKTPLCFRVPIRFLNLSMKKKNNYIYIYTYFDHSIDERL